jgi:hypothetical protein
MLVDSSPFVGHSRTKLLMRFISVMTDAQAPTDDNCNATQKGIMSLLSYTCPTSASCHPAPEFWKHASS